MILKTFENEDRLALACPVFTKGCDLEEEKW
jgi:hypothetical protein